MAKKQKPQKRRAATVPAQPLAALYRLEAGTPRGDAVRSVLADQGIRVRTVSAERLGDPVGAIAGLKGFHPVRTPYKGEVPESEFMLLANVPGKMLDSLLAAMREAGCSVACKAQVTQHNRTWPFALLVREVSREHTMIAEAQSAAEVQAEAETATDSEG